MLQDFGVISKDRTRLAPTTRHELVHALQEFLLSLVPLHAHAVLVIDEAQHLQPDVMEQLRLVSNVHDAAGTLLQIVLVGQPSLDAVLSRPELRQLKQRVSRHVRLEPLGIAELSQYIDHRLAVAREAARPSHGAVTFAPEALSAIWRLSGGTPRVINLLCDRALEAAYEQQAHSVGAPLVDAAAAELGFRRVSSPLPRPRRPRASTVARRRARADRALRTKSSRRCSSTFRRLEAPATRRSSGVLVVAAVVVVAAGAAWFGVRAVYPSDQPPRALHRPRRLRRPNGPRRHRRPRRPRLLQTAPASSSGDFAAAPPHPPATASRCLDRTGAPPAAVARRIRDRRRIISHDDTRVAGRGRTERAWSTRPPADSRRLAAGPGRPVQDPGSRRTKRRQSSTRRDTPARRSSPPRAVPRADSIGLFDPIPFRNRIDRALVPHVRIVRLIRANQVASWNAPCPCGGHRHGIDALRNRSRY